MEWSPAHHAVEHEDLPTLRDLLDNGHDVQDSDTQGWSLLHHSIDVEIDGHQQTGEPLHVDVTAYLLARGANPSAASHRYGTPLQMAEDRGHWLATELIRSWLARPNSGSKGSASSGGAPALG
ncbi:ankyrin repeat domain-containing protein [Microbispora sp. NPDC049125]|uniref:ankyrin repeat domain-containing protein n=1 Tax=Microbispora sp. NPDC049125 TaxID=3154929 RepID=UPI0034672814